ncbi:D-aminoacyl-tRNA deacylase [uncultured archaeon]|nr:D-aminoacyl-tRNA deacylase [uncultured archaeon]
MDAVIYSTQDPAGTNIAKQLEKDEAGITITGTESGLLYAEKDVERMTADFLIFASKHRSESGTPTFTVHVPGNWNAAEMGGKPGQISESDPISMKAMAVALDTQKKKAGIDIGIGMEVDHHGPLCMTPCCFTEIGSTEKEWKTERHAEAVAAAIERIDDARKEIEVKEVAFCIGGGHYCPAFNRMELEGNIAVAHVLPNYAADAVTADAFMQAFERTTEDIDVVLIDWKGLKAPQKEKVLKLTSEAGAEWRKA